MRQDQLTELDISSENNLLMWQNLFYFNLNQILQKKMLPSVVVMVKGLALKLKITPNSKNWIDNLKAKLLNAIWQNRMKGGLFESVHSSNKKSWIKVNTPWYRQSRGKMIWTGERKSLFKCIFVQLEMHSWTSSILSCSDYI